MPLAGRLVNKSTIAAGSPSYRKTSPKYRKTGSASHRVGHMPMVLCHLVATVENGNVASQPQAFRREAPTIRLVSGYVSMRCRMWRLDEDTFTMISGLVVIALVCVTVYWP